MAFNGIYLGFFMFFVTNLSNIFIYNYMMVQNYWFGKMGVRWDGVGVGVGVEV